MLERKSHTILERLVQNKTAFVSLCFLFLLLLLSCFAFLFIPDKTKSSNNQQLELALKEPGFKYQILSMPKEKKPPSLLKELIYGRESRTEEIPFVKLLEEEKQIHLTTHLGQSKYLAFDEINLTKKNYKNHIANKSFLLGSDKYGRDILSRLILGIRISLVIGFMSVFISLIIGIIIGASGAFFGGWVDKMAMFLINVTWSIPTLLLVFAIVIAFGRGMWIIFLAVGLTLWVDVARLVRGQVMQIKQEEYIMATQSLSFNAPRIIVSHILPNIIGPLLVIAATNFAIAILIEAGLSYLGFGIQPPAPSVGNMLNENYGYAISGKPFLAFIPSITIMSMVLAFNLVGSGLRDILDVKSTS